MPAYTYSPARFSPKMREFRLYPAYDTYSCVATKMRGWHGGGLCPTRLGGRARSKAGKRTSKEYEDRKCWRKVRFILTSPFENDMEMTMTGWHHIEQTDRKRLAAEIHMFI